MDKKIKALTTIQDQWGNVRFFKGNYYRIFDIDFNEKKCLFADEEGEEVWFSSKDFDINLDDYR